MVLSLQIVVNPTGKVLRENGGWGGGGGEGRGMKESKNHSKCGRNPGLEDVQAITASSLAFVLSHPSSFVSVDCKFLASEASSALSKALHALPMLWK